VFLIAASLALLVVLSVVTPFARWLIRYATEQPQNATLVAALCTLLGVFIAQIVNVYLARTAESRRAQDNALQRYIAYLDQLSDQEFYKDLRKSEERGYKRAVVRARMTTLLLDLDGKRKGILLQFLNDAKLIRKQEYLRIKDKHDRGWNYPIIKLEGIDLSGAKLGYSSELEFADLSGANLNDADFSGATLWSVNLHKADLRNANLTDAKLIKPDPLNVEAIEERGCTKKLLSTNLSEADLRRADLTRTDLTGADLRGADLSGAKGLTRDQTEQATGDGLTILPKGIDCPKSWRESTRDG
jgi:uncharacterized protein YjbI with pentapeptide repeats